MSRRRKNEEPPEIITDPGRITTMLQHIYQQRGLLTVTFPKAEYGNVKGDSLIVEVNKAGKHLLLNMLKPDQAHTRFISEKRAQVISFISGIEITFNVVLKSFIKEDDDLYYLTDFPRKLSYHQKRSAHRAHTSHVDPVPIIIKLDDESELFGVIEDISIGGLSISFTKNLPQSLQVETILSSCTFIIPENQHITCELNIRFIHHNCEHSTPKIGARFESHSREVHRQIMQFVMALDREKRRTSLI